MAVINTETGEILYPPEDRREWLRSGKATTDIHQAANLQTTQDLIAMLIRRVEGIPRGGALRPGMVDTPRRIEESWPELFAGYTWDDQSIKDMLTQFEQPCDEMVICRNIEFYSTCEHHWMTFSGVAHVAYIPNNNRIVGLSKLARLLDVHARRFQNQENIGQSVTNDLMKHLQPKGAACTIVAKHFCMCARGVGKQNSDMVTQSLVGAFKDDPATRMEYLTLLGLK